MVRWRYLVVLAVLLLLPVRTSCEEDEDEEDDGRDGNEEEEEEEEPTEKTLLAASGRRAPAMLPSPKPVAVTRTEKRRPLECYFCAYKSDNPQKACLDPTKFRVHTGTCSSAEDKCVTVVLTKGNTFESVFRGCRSGCVGSPEATCCELNRCNNQAFAMPVVPSPKALTTNKAKAMQPTVVFFITVLLVLQTVVKVAFV